VSGHLHPFRRINPGVGGEEMKFDSKDVALSAVFAALYVIINVLQMLSPFGNPSIYGPVQLRVADCLIALAALFGLPVVVGVTTGCLFTNAYYFLAPQDVILGSVANLIAAGIVFYLRRHKLLACVAGALPIGIIVGGYLWLFLPPPDILGVLPVWAAMILSITVSSLIAVAVIGYLLLMTLSRPAIVEPLKSMGLKDVTE